MTTFREAAESHLDEVYGYLVYLTGSASTAEELTGETFERALRLWGRFDERRGTARTWLFQVARTAALDHFRSERRRLRREAAYAAEIPESGHEQYAEGLSPALSRALSTLSPGEREVIALRVVLDLDGPSAARTLGISATACSTRLSRALEKLEEALRADVAA